MSLYSRAPSVHQLVGVTTRGHHWNGSESLSEYGGSDLSRHKRGDFWWVAVDGFAQRMVYSCCVMSTPCGGSSLRVTASHPPSVRARATGSGLLCKNVCDPWCATVVTGSEVRAHPGDEFEPCLFRKFAVREEPAADGGSIAPGEFVGCVLLEVDDHLMGGPGKAHHESMERLRQRIKFGMWHRLLQDGPSFFRRTPLHTATRSKF